MYQVNFPMFWHSRSSLRDICFRFIVGTICAANWMLGCTPETHEDHNDFEEVCLHMQEGPETTYDAALSADAAPLMEIDHQRCVIDFEDADTEKMGFVSFRVTEAGHHLFALSASATLRLTDATGAGITLTREIDVDFDCPPILEAYSADLVIGTYVLELEAPADTPLSLVVEIMAHEDEHEHDDDRE